MMRGSSHNCDKCHKCLEPRATCIVAVYAKDFVQHICTASFLVTMIQGFLFGCFAHL